MKVRATKTGFYEHKRRYVGNEFIITEKKHFSPKWMEEVGKTKVTPQAEEPVAEEPKVTSTDEVI